MANLAKAERRDRQRHKRRNGMRRSGDSVKTIQTILIRKGSR